jgi:hypothetical protein
VLNVPQIYFDRTKDLLHAILVKLGGTDMDIEQIYNDQGDDLLYAILKKLTGGGGGGGGDVELDFVKSFIFGGVHDPYTLPQKSVIKYIVARSKHIQNIKIGTALGLDDVMPTSDFVVGEVKVFTPNVWTGDADITLYDEWFFVGGFGVYPELDVIIVYQPVTLPG